MKRVWIIFRKEVRDNLRDRRTISSSVLSAFITPALLIGLIVVLGKTLNVNPEEKPLQLPVSGAEYAPGLISFLEERNVEILPAPADPAAAVRDGSQDVILIIASDYPEAFRKGEPAPVQVILDTSRQSASASMQRVRSLLNEYSGMLGMLRLQARGVSPALLSAVAIGVRDLATPQSQALLFLNMMPFFITLSIFSGGMFVIIDATAGERERGSLEPLFINPVKRWEFVIGKLSASLPFALVSLALVLFIFWAGFTIVPVEDFIGFPMVLDGQSLMAIYLLCLPEILLAAALQMLIATYTRSFKEAQTYLSFMPIIIALPAIFLSFTSVQSTLAFMTIPTYGQSLLINQILRGEQIPTIYWVVASVVTTALALFLIFIAMRLYQREQVLFGKT